MKILGLDIGTTTVSAVVVDNGFVIASKTLKNGSFIETAQPWEKIQDPHYIRNTALSAVQNLLAEHPDVERIGITGQMHGIVYLNAAGEPVSPLYTWQDGRGDQLGPQGETYTATLSRITGYAVAAGYGLVTHYYNLKNGLVPADAVVFSTIHDYIAMLLAGLTRPVTEASDAASFGLFHVEKGCFDLEALEKAGIPCDLLPQLAPQPCIGYYQDRIPVFVAIGDNQASFLGATGGRTDAMLVNVGTGSQFSAYTPKYMACQGLETRPFPDGGYLLVGASLCGGRAYALLESFLRDAAQAMGSAPTDSCYDAMAALLAQGKPEDLPTISPLFQGTRQDPSLRGSITNLSTENFTVRHLIYAMLEGMTDELHTMYCSYRNAGGQDAALIGSGNGLRKNVYLQDCFSRAFGQPVVMSHCNEEAATGAALFAASNSIEETL